MPRDGHGTRERILQAAERLMSDQGYSATSVDQVIAEAGSSKGGFFHHFSSKTDLAVHIVEHCGAGGARPAAERGAAPEQTVCRPSTASPTAPAFALPGRGARGAGRRGPPSGRPQAAPTRPSTI